LEDLQPFKTLRKTIRKYKDHAFQHLRTEEVSEKARKMIYAIVDI
jgi:hypothetical protein